MVVTQLYPRWVRRVNGEHMTIPEDLIHPAQCIAADETAMDAAWKMKSRNVGSLVVTNGGVPVGMVTDRDIALYILEQERDPGVTPVAECMTHQLVSLRLHEGISDAIDLMRRNGIRRLPVVDEVGELRGIVAADDLVIFLSGELEGLATTIRSGLVRGATGQAHNSHALGVE